ncbi:hypothetical protein SAMD00019534_013540 [Acytostelium subglobosum LB1]|uniref:hypothetical protein n=1 Tax=Acytostelium subglobosum LB1 TaxID=1410327 RepID=UPI000644BD0B|nr:hypothetical protein SAMD00019534_013540 [Acytostelium subglobosum LB1]GAM18179.1 hypothetical protein SAMD00019534_013540 [Acytostelium subglobosum LB1]|eukprot:XP_012758775.1 hypothetical protein SAMD00019534_013540 [Acytostelium subglobosum LB1]
MDTCLDSVATATATVTTIATATNMTTTTATSTTTTTTAGGTKFPKNAGKPPLHRSPCILSKSETFIDELASLSFSSAGDKSETATHSSPSPNNFNNQSTSPPCLSTSTSINALNTLLKLVRQQSPPVLSPRSPSRRSSRSNSIYDLRLTDLEQLGSQSSLASSRNSFRARSVSEVVFNTWDSADIDSLLNDDLSPDPSLPSPPLSPPTSSTPPPTTAQGASSALKDSTSSATTTSSSISTTLNGADQPAGVIHERKKSASVVPSKDLTLDDNNLVVAGTIDRMVALLTDISSYTGTQYVEDFLFTYHYFMKDEELLARLDYRFNNPLNTEQLATLSPEYQQQITQHVKLRVVNVLKKWVEGHGYDFQNPDLILPLSKLLDQLVAFNPKWGNHIKRSLSSNVVRLFSEDNRKETRLNLKNLVYINVDMETYAELMSRGLPLKVRKKNFVSIKNSFIGREAVDWIQSTLELETRDQAVLILQRMMDQDLIKHYSERGASRVSMSLANAESPPVPSSPLSLRFSLPLSSDRPAGSVKIFRDQDTVYYFPKDWAPRLEATDFPQPIVSRIDGNSTFLDVSPVEIARQLVIIEFSLFKLITPSDLYHQSWNKPNADIRSPNLMKFIERSNTLSYWVATEIVLSNDMKQRTKVLKRFIIIASILRKMNAWNPLMGIMLGLSLGSVQRLKRTWETLPKHVLEFYEVLSKETSATQNYANYRKALQTPTYPSIPYFAIYLRDLTFIEEGNNDYLSNGFINFTKMKMISKVLTEIHRFQSVPYRLIKIEPVQQILTNPSVVLKDIEVRHLDGGMNQRSILTRQQQLYKASKIQEDTIRSVSKLKLNHNKK